MPEYQMFPEGMWHMLGAVMLMVFCIAITVMLVSTLAEPWLRERTLMYLELAVLVVLGLVLSTATFLLSRGWSVCHRFLLWHNRAYILTMVSGTVGLFFFGSTGMATVGIIGLALALVAHQLYMSPHYVAGVEHYRLIWAHHRHKKHQNHG